MPKADPTLKLCKELLHELEKWTGSRIATDLKDRARKELESSEDPALAAFREYFRSNYPGPSTIISDPDRHAPRVFHAARDAISRHSRPTESELISFWGERCFGKGPDGILLFAKFARGEVSQ